jgi:hypothetical protein
MLRKWRQPESRRWRWPESRRRKSNGANQKMAASEKSVSQVQWGEPENGGVRKVGVTSPMGRIRKWRHPQSRCRKSNGAKQKMAACAELVSQLILLPGHC